MIIAFLFQDVNQTNVINYTEFLAATLETQGSIEEYRLSECFDQMDSDDSGEKEFIAPKSSYVLRCVRSFVSLDAFPDLSLQVTFLERIFVTYSGNTAAKRSLTS